MSQFYAQWRDGFQVVWRNLTWGEYRKFKDRYESSQFVEPMDIALEVYKAVRIEGPEPNFVPAGIPAYICKQQMLNNPFSGRFEDIAPAVEMARRVVTNDYLLSAKALISATLNYRPEEIDNWDPNTFFIRLAQTEVANGRTFDPVDPKAIPTKGVRPNHKKTLTPAQQKVLDRTRDRDRRA